MQRSEQSRIELVLDTLILTPVYDLGEFNAIAFSDDVKSALCMCEQGRARNVIIDFSHTRYFGSDAVNLFLKVHRALSVQGGRLLFCGLSSVEREILTVMALDTMWAHYPTRGQALEAVQRRELTILVVDDSEVDRQLIGGLLAKDERYHVSYAEGGAGALELMRRELPDLVLTDLMMPGTDGLALVAAVRRLYPCVPVVLMTAYDDEAIAADALERGATCYIAKSKRAEQLVDTVTRVMARCEASRSCQAHEGGPRRFEGAFTIESDPTSIGPLVDLVQHNLSSVGTGDTIEQTRIGIALEEALTNALYHGNLELDTEQAHQARRDNGDSSVREWLDQRRHCQKVQERQIILEVKISPEVAEFSIHDGGKGFDRHDERPTARGCFEFGVNRGMMLMYTLMDNVRYNAAGNAVTLERTS